MKELRVVFMGTPEFSVPVLEGLIENCNVVGVVTQPDRYVGRKKVLTMPDVKVVALEHNIPVVQPVKIKEDYQGVLDLKPDLILLHPPVPVHWLLRLFQKSDKIQNTRLQYG